MFGLPGHSGSMTFPMSYDESDLDGSSSSSGKGWYQLNSFEKALVIALTIVCLISLGLMIAVIITGIKLSKDNYIATPKPTGPTEHPPWITTVSTPSSMGTDTHRPRPTSQPPGYNTCITKECVLRAAEMMKNLFISVDPCKDFYQFACGGWLAFHENEIPPNKGTWSPYEMQKENLIFEVNSILIREYDYTPNYVKDVDTNLSAVLGNIRRDLNANYLLSVDVHLDAFNTTQYIIYIDQPQFGLEREYLLEEDIEGSYYGMYRQLIVALWEILFPADNAEQVSQSVIEFERQLANLSSPPEERKNLTETHQPFILQDLQELLGNDAIIQLSSLLTQMFNEIVDSDDNPINFDENTEIIVTDIKFVEAFIMLLNETEMETLANYMKWRIIFDYVHEYGNQTLRDLIHAYVDKTEGVSEPEPMWKTCSEATNNLFGMAIGYQYIKDVFDGNYKPFQEVANETVRYIKEAFYENVGDAEWMDDDIKQVALDKAANMQAQIGFPDWLTATNPTPVIRYYDNANLTESTNNFQNFLDMTKWHSWRELKQIVETKDPDKWLIDPTNPNAFYYPFENAITIGLAYLQDFVHTVEDEEFPKSIRFGTLGADIGHELIHGFSESYRVLDAEGNLNDWWDWESNENFTLMSDCFINQYSNYIVEELGENFTINGWRTLEENISDNGGLRLAYWAYKKYVEENGGGDNSLPALNDFSSDQMFFISYAQTWCEVQTPESLASQVLTGQHAPNKYRLIGTIENSKEFAEHFLCPMDEANVCQIW